MTNTMPTEPRLPLLQRVRLWRLRRRFVEGATLARFVARDIKREVEVISADELVSGLVTVRARTWNVLYVSRGFCDEPAFGTPVRVDVDRVWTWRGATSGGPVPADDPLAGNHGDGPPADPMGHRGGGRRGD